MKTIKQFIAEHLLNTEIFYIAYYIYRYKKLIENNIEKTIPYILLIKKYPNSDKIDAWKKHIRLNLYETFSYRLWHKSTNKLRKKYIKELIINELELNSYDNWYICSLINYLNETQLYDDNKIKEEFIEVIHQFQNEILDNLIEVIAVNNDTKIKEFTNNL